MFVTIESLDGAGGTTVANRITEKYPDAVTTSEPSSFEYGKLVRRNLSDEDSDPLVDFYLFMADRRDHIYRRVKPADESGKLVVSDRYSDSTRAYQPVALTGEGKPFDSSWEAKLFIEQTFAYWDYEPDLTLYIDATVDTVIERVAGDEKYEQRQFLGEVKKNYDALADTTDRIVRIDGEQSREGVCEAALAELDVAVQGRL